MDTSKVLEAMVKVFPSLPDQTVEEQLVVFDALLNVSDPGQRSGSAELLKRAASEAGTPARRDRLLQASEAVAAGKPCDFTPDGLSAAQAAAAQTTTADKWQEPQFGSQEPEVREEDDDDQEDLMEEAPPQLPHLPVRHFFDGLVVRVAQPFTDSQGRKLSTGELLELISYDPSPDGSCVLNVLVRTVRLNPKAHGQVLENADNSWLQPVPSTDCLNDLCEAIHLALDKEDEDLDAESEEDEDKIDWIGTLRDDVAACLEWMQDHRKRPKPSSAPLAAKVFGRNHPAVAWIRLLYAAVAVNE
jgi:hypothetical protein